MSLTLLVAILLFAFVATITPGPNNIMVTASGANFGYVRTIPHLLGISIGFPIMLAAVGFGLGQVFQTFPIIHQVLKVVGAAYLLWLAWKITTAKPASGNRKGSSPLTFLQVAAFQWVNPKAWIMAISAFSTYTTVGGNLWLEVTVITLAFAIIAYPCVSLWTLLGVGVSGALNNDQYLRWFNYTMALLLVASIAPIIYKV